jgi:large subunit ribosomal protein L20
MARIKRGTTKSRRHKAVLDRTKGYQMSNHRLYKRAKEASLHAGAYSYAHRRHRRGQMRQSWIKILAAGLSDKGISYSQFIGKLTTKGITLDRKIISELAGNYPNQFNSLVEQVIA